MKNTFLTLSIAVFISCCFFAPEALARPSDVQTVKGKVDSVSIGADPMRGNVAEITIISEGTQKMDFEVNTGIGITIGASDRVVTLDQLKKGDTITVDYMTTKANIKKVMTIELFGHHEK